MQSIKTNCALLFIVIFNMAFTVLPTSKIKETKIYPPQLNKHFKPNFKEKIIYKIFSKRLNKIQDDEIKKVKKRGDYALAFAILTPILFLTAAMIQSGPILILALLVGITALFLGIFTFTDIYASKSDKTKALLGIIIGMLSIGVIILGSISILELF